MVLNKFVVTALCAACMASINSHAFAGDDDGSRSLVVTQPLAKVASKPDANQAVVVKSNANKAKARDYTQAAGFEKFVYDPTLPSNVEYTYIVELNELSVAQDTNASAEMRFRKQQSTQSGANRSGSKNEIQNFAIQNQINKIERQQSAFLSEGIAQLINVKPLATYKYGINGMAIKATQAQAQSLAQSPHVRFIQKEQKRSIDTDRGPVLIGAPQVWDGTAFSGVSQTLGEGIVIGVIDSGINTDHPSFAEVAGDGYVHTNPRGDGNYLGDCAGDFAQLCNNKLIGLYSYPEITGNYSDTSIFPPNLPRNGEDYGGHGSHVTSIAAGNILLNVDEVFPTEGQERSSGTPTGFTFERISGVAPRANIIMYQVCFGGLSVREDTFADCLDSAILKAIDDAIRDNVDVINFSISGGGNPWRSSTELAFLSARNAGIVVAVSAGNSGPGPNTSEKSSPWYSAVAASEHGRENVFAKQINDFTGGASSLSAITGQSNTGSLTAPIVFAGDFNNPNDPGGDPAQCLEAFPSGTFSGQIVVCDRGDIARIQKAVNVRDGGASGYVLANIDGGTTFLANDQYVVPGIHINAADGNRLKDWLATGTDHSATITQSGPTQVIDASRVDVISDFSSRGPNEQISTLTPTMTAPGSNIFAAYADEQLGHDGHAPAASDFTTLNGTSMSSPHVAGASALIKSVNPTWGPDEIRSALALTATTLVRKEDATTPADFFDMGSGRIQVNQAVASPLIMSETAQNYANADPALSGEPRSLNLPSITDTSCEGVCTWSRTFKATTNATFDYEFVSITDGLTVDATPSRFTLLEGQSQTVTFTINSSQASKIDYSFALAKFTTPGFPDVSLPVTILSSIGDFPVNIEFDGRRNADSLLVTDIDAINIDDFILTAFQPVKATVVNGELSQDSDSGDFLDNINDGVSITRVTVPQGAKRFIAEIKESTASDVDLFVLFDADGNGSPSSDEEIANSRSFSSVEEVQINFPEAGTYFIAVQNFQASTLDSDSFDMRFAVVNNSLAGDSLQAEAPSQLVAGIPFDIRVIYDLPQSQSGDSYYAAFGMGTTQGREDLGILTVDINREDNDVFIDGASTQVVQGDQASLNVVVSGNPTNEARSYQVVLPVPVGTQITNFSTANNGQLVNNQVIWEVDHAAGSPTATNLNFTVEVLSGLPSGPIIVNAQSELTSQEFTTPETTDDFTGLQVEGLPVTNVNNGAPNPSSDDGGGGSMSWLILCLFPIAIVRRLKHSTLA